MIHTIPITTINNCCMPVIGLGTYQMRGEECYTAVMNALKLGYRHIDSATVYGNENQIGQAIRDAIQQGIIPNRNHVFITTKIAPKDHGEENAFAAVHQSRTALGVDKIDLILIHWPGQYGHSPSSSIHVKLRQGTWRALIRHQQLGTVHHIGVSNYNYSHLLEFDNDPTITIKPCVLQIEIHPWYYPDSKILDWCTQNQVILQAYSSLGNGKLVELNMYLPEADVPARRLGVTRAQILLAWARAHGWVILPKSRSIERMQDNLSSIFIHLLPDEILALDNLAIRTQRKLCWDPNTVA